MADLITNLQSIYNTKLQIKEAIGTDSDVFSDYPAYISAMGDSGYTYVTTNGDHSVNGYAYVNVNVPGATEYDHIEISANSQVNVAAYNYAYVSVPVPPGYIIPEGTINIDTVGTHDVTAYANAYVDILVPTYVFGYHDITANGTTYASSYGLDGFTYVNVNVSGGGGSSHSGQSTADAWTIEDAYAYISAFEDTAEHTALDLGFEPVVEGVVASVLPNRNYSSQHPTARFWITRDGSAVAADYSNGILCWNMQSNLAATWTEGIDMQIYPGQHVFVQCTKLQKYLDSNTGNYQMECKNGTAIVRQTSANGQLTISQSGTYDTTTYVSAYVDVQGGGYPETTYSLTGYVLDSTRLLVNDNTVNISNGDTLDLSNSYNLGQEITLPNCVQVYADRFIEARGGNVSNVFWFDNNNTITYTGNTYAFTYTGNIILRDYSVFDIREKQYWYGQYPQNEYILNDNNGQEYFITESDYYNYKDSSIQGLTANISYIVDHNNIDKQFATINSVSPVQYTGFIYESGYSDPSTDVNFTSETIDGHTGWSCNLVIQDLSGQGGTGELVGGGVVRATTDGENYNDIYLNGLDINDGTTLSDEQRYFGKFGSNGNLNVGWYDNNNTCASMKLFIYLDGSTWVAKYIWTLTA